jgi:hypothetical protein
MILLTEMVFSLNIINTVVDGNDFTFSLSCVPHKIRSKVKSHFRLIIHYYDLIEL